MNSIHDAIRKFRPDLKLEGLSGSARLVPAAAVYPDSIRPEDVVRGLAGGRSSSGLPEAAPDLGWRSIASVALVFAIAAVCGAGLAFRPAGMGDVAATPVQRTIAKYEVADIPAPAGFQISIPAAAEPVAEKTIKLAGIPKRQLAPLKKADPEYVSLQPVKTPDSALVTPASEPQETKTALVLPGSTESKPVNSGMPEILYESESPQALPEANAIAAAPSTIPVKVDKPADASNLEPSSSSSSSSGGKVRIQGIFWDSQRPMALLGDDIVEVGSMTPLGKVVEITKKNVVFDRNGARVTLAP